MAVSVGVAVAIAVCVAVEVGVEVAVAVAVADAVAVRVAVRVAVAVGLTVAVEVADALGVALPVPVAVALDVPVERGSRSLSCSPCRGGGRSCSRRRSRRRSSGCRNGRYRGRGRRCRCGPRRTPCRCARRRRSRSRRPRRSRRTARGRCRIRSACECGSKCRHIHTAQSRDLIVARACCVTGHAVVSIVPTEHVFDAAIFRQARIRDVVNHRIEQTETSIVRCHCEHARVSRPQRRRETRAAPAALDEGGTVIVGADEDVRRPRQHRNVGDVARVVGRHSQPCLPAGFRQEDLAYASTARIPSTLDSAGRDTHLADVVAEAVLRRERGASHRGDVRAGRHFARISYSAGDAGSVGRIVLQAGRSPIARGDKHRLPLGRGLLEQRVEAIKEAHRLAAVDVADADRAAGAVGHALRNRIVKIAGDIRMDRSARRGRLRVLDVEQSLDLVAADARRASVGIYIHDGRRRDFEKGAVVQRHRRRQIVGVLVHRNAIRRGRTFVPRVDQSRLVVKCFHVHRSERGRTALGSPRHRRTVRIVGQRQRLKPALRARMRRRRRDSMQSRRHRGVRVVQAHYRNDQPVEFRGYRRIGRVRI